MIKHADYLQTFKRRVEKFLVRTGTPPSTFGRKALNNPKFINLLREGREPRPSTMDAVERFMAKNDKPRRKRRA